MHKLFDLLSDEQKTILTAIKKHAISLLDNNPRFKYFTLHGKTHIENLFSISNLFLDLGFELDRVEAYYLSIAICIHDLGMVVPLNELDAEKVFDEEHKLSDIPKIEKYIRDTHHNLIDNYVINHFDFLSSLGVKPFEIAIIKEIARGHRIINLKEQSSYSRKLGALLRIIDELDVGPKRAPTDILLNTFNEMDGTSCWHWFKHNIVDDWNINHNIKTILSENTTTIQFEIIVRPPSDKSIPYWLQTIYKPFNKLLYEEGVQNIINEFWNKKISISKSIDRSRSNRLSHIWDEIEVKALTFERKVILLVDDEVRKMEDLLLPLMNDYYVIFSPNAKDALDKIKLGNIDLAIIDMQIGSGNIWSAEETDGYKTTGLKIAEEIKLLSPSTKIVILTGTRYEIDMAKVNELSLFLRKPVDPDKFEEIIHELLK